MNTHKLVHYSVEFQLDNRKKKKSPKPPAVIRCQEEIWSASLIPEFMRLQTATEEFNIVPQIYVMPQGCHFGKKANTSKASGLRWQTVFRWMVLTYDSIPC